MGTYTGIVFKTLYLIILCFNIADLSSGDEPTLYGTTEENLGTILKLGGKKVWLDTTLALESGTVLSFVAYIGNLSDVTTPLKVRLQVWSLENTEQKKYSLKWEKSVEISVGNKIEKFDLGAHDFVAVTSTDKIGFLCEQDACPFSYKNSLSYIAHFFKYTSFPEIDDVIAFDQTPFPAQFSFGVYIGEPTIGSIVYKGNPLVQASVPENPGKKAWIQESIELTTGIISRVEFMAAQVQGTKEQVQVQVWYPAESEFRLLWQYAVPLNKGEGKYSVEIPPAQSIIVNSSCVVGWTYLGEGPIYATFDGNSQSKYYTLPESDDHGPKVGEVYGFDLPFPNRFSFGYWIDTERTSLPESSSSSTTVRSIDGQSTSTTASFNKSTSLPDPPTTVPSSPDPTGDASKEGGSTDTAAIVNRLSWSVIPALVLCHTLL